MTKLVVCLLFFGLYAIQTVGQMNSDPAPGRSPGPPHAVGATTTTTTTMLTPMLISTTATLTNTSQAIQNLTKSTLNEKKNNNNTTDTQQLIDEYSNDRNNNYITHHQYHRNDENEAYIVEPPVNATAALHAALINQAFAAVSAAAAAAAATAAPTPPPAHLHVQLPAAAAAAVDASDAVLHRNWHTTNATTTPANRNQLNIKTATANTTTTKTTTGTAKSCRAGLNELLNDVVVIDETTTNEHNNDHNNNDNSNNNNHNDMPQLPRLELQLQLEHDIFDTTTLGINCGLMYKVRLSTRMDATATLPLTHYSGEFFVETLSARNGRERGSFVGHSLGNKLPISWFSTLQRNGKDGETLPPNWFSSQDEDSNASDESNENTSEFEGNIGDGEANDDVSLDAYVVVSKNDFNNFTIATDENNFTSRHDYDQEAFLNKWPPRETTARQTDSAATSTGTSTGTGRRARKTNQHENAKLCPDNKWQGNCQSNTATTTTNPAAVADAATTTGADGNPTTTKNNRGGNSTIIVSTESLNLWMVNELCEQDETIEFRVLFRATIQQHTSGSDSYSTPATANAFDGKRSSPVTTTTTTATTVKTTVVAYRKAFQFHLRKECQLMLHESASGQLDYTTLPLYSIDCTVHFPSYQKQLSTTQVTVPASTPPPGILVGLQRLNVPCNSGGYVRFNERKALCGKLEELQETDRTYHFDVRLETIVRFYKNPMFSLSYKLVDYCYNVSTSNQSGEYYIQSSMRDTLECYFRIHLPYGNRILLRLVANNDSDILQTAATSTSTSDDAYPGATIFNPEEAYSIYTSQGVTVPTQIVNLTLSGRGYVTPLYVTSPTVNGDEENRNRTNSLPTEINQISGGSLSYTLFSGVHALGAAAHCEGLVIKVFENEFSKWSHCLNSSQIMRGFILESASNTLSVHLYRSGSGRPSQFEFYRPLYKTENPIVSSTLLPAIYLSYQTRPVPEIVSNCAFGWIAMQQFCISAIELALPWLEAEQHCVGLGGHLVSIRNDMHQQVINQLLLHSPGYHNQNAYWVGGSDKSYEGDFRWSDGLSFQYTNWFPGWSQHGHYNKQPNDDGLSSQDCIELRRYFRTPPGIQTNRSPLTSNFMWNDRDCTAKNFLICERAMSDESFRRNWINDCNKTVSLTKEHPRASIWSPSFPRQYPDNANCFTTITAPTGYRIVIEFEELVIENEPGCTYDYLEITEPSHLDTMKSSKSSRHGKNAATTAANKSSSSNNNNNNNNNDKINNSNINTNKTFRKRSSYENPSLSSSYTSASASMSTINSNTNTNANTNTNSNFNIYNTNVYANSYGNDINLYESNNYNNYNLAQTNYQKMLHIYSSLYRPHTNFIIQTPDYPKGNPFYNHLPTANAIGSSSSTTSGSNNLGAVVSAAGPTVSPGAKSSATGTTTGGTHTRNEDLLPKRLCGDWSSKLKLLRHVSTGSYLGLHFVSDYSHHFGGYKAKTYMENTASECANERLKPYNGSCYLFVAYPEVDWWTAQQVCRGMGAKLSSVSSLDEHRFITSNIRNQIDYSPQLIYWLGAELEKNGHFEWTDDTKMSFEGWLPGQGQFDVMPPDATCLGLQWKMSPTPMLPSGLYWQSQKCTKVGGYVCKKPKESFGKFAFNNFTVTGTEGRLVSPAYPNTYPLNIDYWIHIKSPQRTRIVVQFQKIDLEPQDECLYDYVSIQNYELVSKITLEPGSNPMPMAMLASEELLTPNDGDNDNDMQGAYGHRIKRSFRRNKRKALRNATAKRRKRNTVNNAHILPPDFKRIVKDANVWQLQNHKDKSLNRRHHNNNNNKNGNIMNVNREWRESTATKTNENRKRRRRKKSLMKMDSALRNSLRNNKYTMWHNFMGVQHLQRPQHGRQRRSTGDGGPATVVNGNIMNADTDMVLAPPTDNAQSFLPYVRWCGSHDSNMSKFDFVSSANEVMLNFHSDYSVTGLGFAAVWKAIDVSGCPVQTLTSREGTVYSPNYPHFLLNNLNCEYVIKAPLGRRVWLEFNEFDLMSDVILELDIGNGLFRPFRGRNQLNDGLYVSLREQLRIQFRTGQHPRGRGFHAVYHTVGLMERRERVINLTNNATGYLFQLNYPHDMPVNVDFTQHLVAPFGHNILLELHGVEFSENGCPDNNILEIYDNYADNNGTNWKLCRFQNVELRTGSPIDGFYHLASTEEGPTHGYQQPYAAAYTSLDASNRYYQEFAAPPVHITSYLNTLHIRQRTTTPSDANLNATVRIQLDNNYKMKLATEDKTVESCQPNPCQYNGKCVLNNGIAYCQCQGHYTGRFCGLTVCELEPCVFGKCELTATSFKCQCQIGYMGATCEQKQRPCADNPCEGRGICTEKNGVFHCRCHAWWEGPRCERRMMHIPYKPLSERMLQEPFWLGLITVFVVLAVIGLVWCAKRHFPEKIEKLLAEEADRNRPPGSIHGHHHHTSLREQLQFTTAIPQTTVNNAPGAPRSIFNRLGIRKPSLLSLSSPNPTPGGGGAAARTFSLDDLLRPPPRRSPSPRKKRNNSTPVKKNAAEKKQILQQLVSPAAAQAKPKVSLDELISMSENRLRIGNVDSESDLKETTFSENSGSVTSAAAAVVSVARTITDPKLEKKVTFARLLNKVSAEMSSGSEMDIGQMGGTRNSSALSLPTDIQFRASSMPPSPCTNDIRSPHSTSSNQGSDSLSSSDLALTDFGLRSMQLGLGNVNNDFIGVSSNSSMSGMPPRCRLGSAARPKVSSADSILAMFRNFASSATTSPNTTTAIITSNASVFVSPSTTPTASSPQDDALGDDESSTSSMHTPVSFSSGAPDSPVFYRQTTIEVPVLDVLNAHKNSSPSSSTSSSSGNLLHPPTILLEIPSNGINNKCLSPIREMPTPIPSPALTPIMPRPQRSNSPVFQEDPLSGGDFTDDDDKSDHSDRSDAQLSEKLLLSFQKSNKHRIIDSDVETTPTDIKPTSIADVNKQHTTMKVPQLQLTPAMGTPMNALVPPLITVGVEPPTPEDRAQRPRDLIIPTLTVEQPSPTKNRHPMIIFPGSPPPQRASIGETSFMFPNKQQQKRLLKQYEKPTSLDFPFVPPMITVTSNMSELESDTEPLSPAPKTGTVGGLMPPNPVGMCYLSPFTMCSRADRTISESNLSSSGYSSMASPGPSRCGSSNPLCPNEMDEPGSGHSGAGLSLHMSLLNRRKSSALPSCKENVTNGKNSGAGSGASGSNTNQLHGHRPRSDSETFSDDILLESNDEGISTDHVDDKLEDHRLSANRLRELDVFLEEQVLIEVEEPSSPVASLFNMTTTASNQMAQLQLPSIVIQIDGSEKGGLSPVSSRSESPLSDRAGIGRFSPHFYGRKDQLPFTDSDGLYDFPSSDGKGTSAQTYTHQRRSSSKKRERKSSKCSATQSPTKQQLDVHLSKDVLNTNSTATPSSGSHHICSKHCYSLHHPCPVSTSTARKSPKRRTLNRPPIASSSSSSESLASTKELTVRPLPRRLNSPNREKRPRKQESLSEDEVADALLRRISPSIVKEDESTKPKCKINRLRAIGNQIRFLRRLEKSIKTRERIASPTDSCPEENTDDMDSPQATSPLLQPTSPNKTRIALCRQKRLPSGTYGITAAALNSSNWKGMDRSLIGDDLNSD